MNSASLASWAAGTLLFVSRLIHPVVDDVVGAVVDAMVDAVVDAGVDAVVDASSVLMIS